MRLPTFLILALSSVACANRDGSASDSAASTRAVAVSAPLSTDTGKSAASPGKSTCPGTGKWAVCSVERRLKQSGFVVKPLPDTAKRAGFSVRPRVFMLGQSRLEVFIYDSGSAADKDVSGLNTTTAAPRGSPGAWEGQPLFMRSANLIAVLLTPDARQAERVQLAITAGPPQPGSTR